MSDWLDEISIYRVYYRSMARLWARIWFLFLLGVVAVTSQRQGSFSGEKAERRAAVSARIKLAATETGNAFG